MSKQKQRQTLGSPLNRTSMNNDWMMFALELFPNPTGVQFSQHAQARIWEPSTLCTCVRVFSLAFIIVFLA